MGLLRPGFNNFALVVGDGGTQPSARHIDAHVAHIQRWLDGIAGQDFSEILNLGLQRALIEMRESNEGTPELWGFSRMAYKRAVSSSHMESLSVSGSIE